LLNIVESLRSDAQYPALNDEIKTYIDAFHQYLTNIYFSFLSTHPLSLGDSSSQALSKEDCKKLFRIGVHSLDIHPVTLEGKARYAAHLFSRIGFAINDVWEDLDEPETIITIFPAHHQQAICHVIGWSYDPTQSIELNERNERSYL
jgi:hypothetical protein